MTDEDIFNLLPWYVNQTLSGAEKSLVENLLNRSERARQEVQFLRRLCNNIQSKNIQIKSTQAQQLPQVSELGWRRLQRDIRRYQQKDQKSSGRHWIRLMGIRATQV